MPGCCQRPDALADRLHATVLGEDVQALLHAQGRVEDDEAVADGQHVVARPGLEEGANGALCCVSGRLPVAMQRSSAAVLTRPSSCSRSRAVNVRGGSIGRACSSSVRGETKVGRTSLGRASVSPDMVAAMLAKWEPEPHGGMCAAHTRSVQRWVARLDRGEQRRSSECTSDVDVVACPTMHAHGPPPSVSHHQSHHHQSQSTCQVFKWKRLLSHQNAWLGRRACIHCRDPRCIHCKDPRDKHPATEHAEPHPIHCCPFLYLLGPFHAKLRVSEPLWLRPSSARAPAPCVLLHE